VPDRKPIFSQRHSAAKPQAVSDQLSAVSFWRAAGRSISWPNRHEKSLRGAKKRRISSTEAPENQGFSSSSVKQVRKNLQKKQDYFGAHAESL
jgi:hypothetical protein